MGNTDTEFRAVPGFPDYLVGDDGTVISLKFGRRRKLRPCRSKRGYLHVLLHRDGKPLCKTVHRLVAEAFIGPCPPGMECCHYDGDPTNNSVANLRWDTAQANSDDAYRHKLTALGLEPFPLSIDQVRVVKRMLLQDHTKASIAAAFNVSTDIIHIVDVGRQWRNVEPTQEGQAS